MKGCNPLRARGGVPNSLDWFWREAILHQNALNFGFLKIWNTPTGPKGVEALHGSMLHVALPQFFDLGLCWATLLPQKWRKMLTMGANGPTAQSM